MKEKEQVIRPTTDQVMRQNTKKKKKVSCW